MQLVAKSKIETINNIALLRHNQWSQFRARYFREHQQQLDCGTLTAHYVLYRNLIILEYQWAKHGVHFLETRQFVYLGSKNDSS